jgi:hypothetical protein
MEASRAMPKHVFSLGAGLALVALAFVLTDRLLALPPGVTRENVQRLRPGMTVEQVAALLGGPAECDVPFRACVHGLLWEELGYPETCQWWTAPSEGGVYVGFGCDGRVTGCSARGACGVLPAAPGLLSRFRLGVGR